MQFDNSPLFVALEARVGDDYTVGMGGGRVARRFEGCPLADEMWRYVSAIANTHRGNLSLLTLSLSKRVALLSRTCIMYSFCVCR